MVIAGKFFITGKVLQVRESFSGKIVFLHPVLQKPLVPVETAMIDVLKEEKPFIKDSYQAKGIPNIFTILIVHMAL